MHAYTLSRHTEEIRSIRTESVNLQERIANVDNSTALRLKKLQIHKAKLIEIEDRARRDNLLIFNLKYITYYIYIILLLYNILLYIHIQSKRWR